MKTENQIEAQLKLLNNKIVDLAISLQKHPEAWRLISDMAAFRFNQLSALLFVLSDDNDGQILSVTTLEAAYKALQVVYQDYVDGLIIVE